MITLKNLDKASAQEVFDQVATHLLTQNAVSEGVNSCMYRNKDGLICAAGCLIADNEYKAKFEGLPWHQVVDKFKISGNYRDMISDLQQVHDGFYPDQWEFELKKVAKTYELKDTVVKNFKKKGKK